MGIPKIQLTEDQQDKAVGLVLAGSPNYHVAEIIGISEVEYYQFRLDHPLFQARLDSAREDHAHSLADRTLEVALNEKMHAGNQRNQIHAMQWLASKRNSKAYGDKLEVSGSITLDIAGVLDVAERRIGPLLDHGSVPVAQIAEFTDTILDRKTGLEPVKIDSETKVEITFDDLG